MNQNEHQTPESLPDSSSQQFNTDDDVQLAINRQLETILKRQPEVVANAVFPLLGPIIRRSVTDSLNGMLYSFNETLKYSVSFRGLLWRLEAMRTGRTFSEVVLSKTMEFQVEQVFLIHAETGLLFHHVSDLDNEQDPMMISGMLTAIQDFVHSSLGSEDGDVLDTLNVGETTILIERGPYAFLAAVVRGSVPPSLKQVLVEALGEINQKFAVELEAFTGDTAPLEASQGIVESCLVKELKGTEKRFSFKLLIFWTTLIAAVGLYSFVNIRDGIYWRNYIELLNNERGIMVVTAKKEDGKFHVWGLRDSYAEDPITVLKKSKLAFDRVDSRWEPYRSSLPEYVLHRDLDQMVIRFKKGTSEILPADMPELEKAALILLKLAEHLSRGGLYFDASIYGHTNEMKDGDRARILSQQRAEAVLKYFKDWGLADLNIEPKGIGFQQPVRRLVKSDFDQSYNRSATFRVKIREFEE